VLVDREVLAVSPRAQSRIAVLPLRPAKYSPCQLRLQVRSVRDHPSVSLVSDIPLSVVLCMVS
jgi:hypothetical protein